VRMIADSQPDEQIQAAGDDAHVLGLGQGADRLDDLAQVHVRTGGHRDIHDDRIAQRGPVDVGPVAPDDAVAFQARQPVGDSRRRHLDGAGQRALRLARIPGQRAQQRQVKIVYVHLRGGGGRDFGEPGERS
jgi:hypothetical protein